MAGLPTTYAEGWAGDNAVYRTARKTYNCSGNGGPREHATDCPRSIRPGDHYIEYMDGPAYSSGDRVSMACAIYHGYIKVVA